MKGEGVYTVRIRKRFLGIPYWKVYKALGFQFEVAIVQNGVQFPILPRLGLTLRDDCFLWIPDATNKEIIIEGDFDNAISIRPSETPHMDGGGADAPTIKPAVRKPRKREPRVPTPERGASEAAPASEPATPAAIAIDERIASIEHARNGQAGS